MRPCKVRVSFFLPFDFFPVVYLWMDASPALYDQGDTCVGSPLPWMFGDMELVKTVDSAAEAVRDSVGIGIGVGVGDDDNDNDNDDDDILPCAKRHHGSTEDAYVPELPPSPYACLRWPSAHFMAPLVPDIDENNVAGSSSGSSAGAGNAAVYAAGDAAGGVGDSDAAAFQTLQVTLCVDGRRQWGVPAILPLHVWRRDEPPFDKLFPAALARAQDQCGFCKNPMAEFVHLLAVFVGAQGPVTGLSEARAVNGLLRCIALFETRKAFLRTQVRPIHCRVCTVPKSTKNGCPCPCASCVFMHAG